MYLTRIVFYNYNCAGKEPRYRCMWQMMTKADKVALKTEVEILCRVARELGLADTIRTSAHDLATVTMT